MSVLKAADHEAVFKFSGAGTTTISLSGTEILGPNQVTDGDTQTVDIIGFVCTGVADGVATITRNGNVIATCLSSASNYIDLAGQILVPDSTEHTSNIAVTITNQAELWLRVRKVSGYKSKIEHDIYGQYDDPTRIGASTTIVGSPDYIKP